MQGGVDKYQEYPIPDLTRLEPQLQISVIARRHLPDIPRRRILRRIRNKVVGMEPPSKPGLLRYLVLDKAPYCCATSKSGVPVQPVSYPFNRVGHEHGRDHDSGDDIRWGETGLLVAKEQYQPRTRYRDQGERQCALGLALEYEPECQAYPDKASETSPAAMQKLMARQDNADRAKQAQLLLVGKIAGMTDRRRRCRQDIDSTDGKRDSIAKMHGRNCVFRAYGQSEWHNDNNQRQHLHDNATEGIIRAISPC